MRTWRLLNIETHNAFMNMAVDEAILTARAQRLAPNTLRLFCWKPSAVSIGRFQKIENEVQLENCKAHGVDVVRRITGGGAVYHDSEGEVTYSVVANKNDLEAKDIDEVYAKIYDGLAEALKILGIKADFNKGNAKNCPNMTVKGKKISGSAQSHRGDYFLQHGTVLLDVDLEKMFTFLRVPWAKTCMEIVCIAKDKITSLRNELGRNVSVKEVSQALEEGFQKALNIELVDGELTSYERELAEKLCKEKYATREWNFER
ncbi:MAG: biotin/lipoate A/B protein ligase family protein [Candidatus Bathyarchaeia archaeon]